MTYDIQIGTHSFTVEVEQKDGNWRITVDGEPVNVAATAIDEGTLSLLLDDRSVSVHLDRQSSENGSSQWLLGLHGRQVSAEVRDRRRLRRGLHGVEQEGRVRLTAPMAGKVVKLLAAPGDAVEAGQGLLVLEAMKMQNEVRSPKSGTLISLAVSDNGAVATGQLLAEIE
jgi:biotin carboxyl carrier protein